jgi:hypothetical protein
MEDLTLPSVWASFKKWVCCTSILPKALVHFLNFQKNKISKKLNQFVEDQASACGRRVTVGCWPAQGPRPAVARRARTGA